MARIQYQARAAPITPPPSLEWMQPAVMPQRRPGGAHLAQAFFAPAMQPIPPAASWLPPVAPDRLPRSTFQTHQQQAYAAPAMQPVPPADSWLPPVAPSRLIRPGVPIEQQRAFFAPEAQPVPPASGWLPPVAPVRLDGARFPTSQQIAFVAPAQQPVPPVDGWLRQTNPVPQARAGLRAEQQQALWMPAREPVPSMGWLPGAPPVPLLRDTRAYIVPQAWVPNEPAPAPPEFGWFRPPSQPPAPRRDRIWLYQTVAYPVLVPPRALVTPGRILPLLPDTRAILLSPDFRAIELGPDVRCILLPVDEDDMPPTPPQYWSPAASADEDYYWLSLARWLPPDDTVSDPSVVVSGGPTNDPTPLVVVPGSVIIDTGDRTVYVPPGVGPVVDPGPRIQMQLTGGSKGRTYTTTITWHDSAGRTINRQALLPIQW